MSHGDVFDLGALDTSAQANEGAEMTVLHPGTRQPVRGTDGETVTFRLAGMDSKVYREAVRVATNRRFSMQRGTRIKLKSEEIEAEALDLLVACTLGWSGNFALDGQPAEFSPQNARKLYTRLAWLREQADEFIAERENFLPK